MRGAALKRVGLLMERIVGFNHDVLIGIRDFAIPQRSWICHFTHPATEHLATLSQWRPDGLLAFLFNSHLSDSLLSLGTPVVDVANWVKSSVPRVCVDDIAVGALAGTHFLDMGLDRFAFVGRTAFAFALVVATCSVATAQDIAVQALIAKYDVAFLANDIDRALTDEEVRPIIEKVRGYLTFHGFKIGPTNPDALIVDLRDGNQSEVVHGLILIGARKPEACRSRLFAHEATHFFLGRDYGRSSKDAEVEALANAMERLVAPEYLPNCGDR